MNFLIRLLISGLIAYVLSKILSGIHIADFGTAFIFALVLACLNAIIKPNANLKKASVAVDVW